MTNQAGALWRPRRTVCPEILMNTLNELERAYNHYKNDPQFQRELTNLLQEYGGAHPGYTWPKS